MIHRRLFTVLVAGVCTSSAFFHPAEVFAAGSSPSSDGTLVYEAETKPDNESDAAVVSGTGVLSGQYVTQPKSYNPIFLHDLPAASFGNEFTVWVRYRGCSLQLKGVNAGGEQHEMQWLYEKPSEWTWASFGTHSRADIGARILIIVGPDPGEGSGLDAVVFAGKDFDPTGARRFNPAEGSVSSADQPLPVVTVSIDWKRTEGKIVPGAFGLNACSGFDPENTAQTKYQDNLAYMAPGLLRLHSWDIFGDSKTSGGGWLDTKAKGWDAQKIGKALQPFARLDGTSLLINIPGWPGWLKTRANGTLDPVEYDAYAAFCAELVRVVNVEQKRGVKYWEITNERDDVYWTHQKQAHQPLLVDELVQIYNRCAIAMKRVDPTIQTGGPAAARSDFVPEMRQFVRGTLKNLDFLSGHAYASGNAGDSDLAVFKRTDFFGDTVKALRAMLAEESPNRRVPLHINEYNISWTWETHDQRMVNFKGSVFDALATTKMLENGADFTNAWNERDGVFGKMAPDYQLRPSAEVFHLFNRCLLGDRVAASSNDNAVTIFAVIGTGGRRGWVCINRSSDKREVKIQHSGWSPKALMVGKHELSSNGYLATNIEINGDTNSFALLPYSVTVYTSDIKLQR